MTERQTTTLVSRRRLSGDEVRSVRFPRALGGYSAGDVDKFMGRVAAELDQLYQAVEEASHRAAMASQQTQVMNPVAPPAPDASAALRLLHAAEQNAEQVKAQAAHEANQLHEQTRQQAARMLEEARQQARGEGGRIIAEATAEARRQLARYLELAERVRGSLHHGVSGLHRQLGEWMAEAGPAVTEMPLEPQKTAAGQEPPAEAPAQDETPAEAPAAAPRRTRGKTGPQPAAAG